MKWRMMGAVASAGLLFVSTSYADYTIKYRGGSCNGLSIPSYEVNYPGAFDSAWIDEAVPQLNAYVHSYGISSIKYEQTSPMSYNVYYNGCLLYTVSVEDGNKSGGTAASNGGTPAASSSNKSGGTSTSKGGTPTTNQSGKSGGGSTSKGGTPAANPSGKSDGTTASEGGDRGEDDPDGSNAPKAGTPAASSSIAVNKIIRNNIFTQAKPKAQSKKQSPAPASDQPASETGDASQPSFEQSIGESGILTFGAADVFYNKWKIGDEDGETFGLNPSITWGEAMSFALTLPFHVISCDDDTIFGVGLDGAYTLPFRGLWDNFSAGIHAYGMGFFGGDDPESTCGGGPFLSFNYRINPKWILSAGLLVELTKSDGVDLITELVPGANLGFNITENIALNAYGIYYRNVDNSDTLDDDGYVDLGGDLSWALGSWSLSAGAKTAVGMKDVNSTEVYLGSAWIF